MTSFFWAAQTANAITAVVSLAALLIVLWLPEVPLGRRAGASADSQEAGGT